jgi:hypothetical protein
VYGCYSLCLSVLLHHTAATLGERLEVVCHQDPREGSLLSTLLFLFMVGGAVVRCIISEECT